MSEIKLPETPPAIPPVREWVNANLYTQTTWTNDCQRISHFQGDDTFVHQLKDQWKEYVKTIKPYPAGRFNGRGIVICAGGATYLPCAWVNIHMIRKQGCTLPIEVWYTENEINDEIKQALSAMDVTCKNVQDHTNIRVKEYALKPFSILRSSFKEILFLDSDNNCMKDPAGLFEHEVFKKYGAVFWPDLWTTGKNNPIFRVLELENNGEIEQESGQILIDKERCWKELHLCFYFNAKRESYYKMLLGDKDTFRFAWLALGSSFHMIEKPTGFCGFNEPGTGFCGMTMVQHDFEGEIMFLHRNWYKWAYMLDGETMWKEIKRFRPGVNKRLILKNLIPRHNGELEFFDIEGEVETISFEERFGNYELECLKALAALRNSDMYRRFLLHSYFCLVRDGYTSGFMEKVV